jgi:hypothetical protein
LLDNVWIEEKLDVLGLYIYGRGRWEKLHVEHDACNCKERVAIRGDSAISVASFLWSWDAL